MKIIKWGAIVSSDSWSDIWRNEAGLPHRLDGPAITTWNKHNQKECEEWYVNGVLHRENGPAVLEWDLNILLCEEWWIEGKRHRSDGPAVTLWSNILLESGGVPYLSDWYINGVKRTTEIENFLKSHKYKLPLSTEELIHLKMVL